MMTAGVLVGGARLQETTKLMEELNEAKAKAESELERLHRLLKMAEDEALAADDRGREQSKRADRLEAELEGAFQRGAEAMREECARVVDAAEVDARPCVRVSDLAAAIRALPLPEAV